jgi:glycosyltransferase involved in cell wall biosynthesis
MRIAVFHNFMDNIGGAERVGLTLARELQADFYSTCIDKERINKMGFSDIPLISIGKIPVNAPFRQQAALLRFRYLKLGNKYDFYIIDGDWAMSGGVNHKPNLWYVHSPIREIWDLYPYTRYHTVPRFCRWPFDGWVHANRLLNKTYVRHINQIACNSQTTQQRIKNFLGREAVVVHPPIETQQYHFQRCGDFWLSVNRLISHKRVDMQIRAFANLPQERLIIVGSYEHSRHFQAYARYIQSIKTPNVEIRSWVEQNELIDLYANCKGFITTSAEEDFGMAPVEAMASGKPVIAPAEGGYRETIIPNVTGQLIEEIDDEKLRRAILEIGHNPEQYRLVCQKRAQDFDTSVFMKKIKNLINEELSTKKE